MRLINSLSETKAHNFKDFCSSFQMEDTLALGNNYLDVLTSVGCYPGPAIVHQQLLVNGMLIESVVKGNRFTR